MALLRNTSLLFPALVVAVAFSGACSGVPTEDVGTSQQALFANDKAAYEYFLCKGLTSFQAAAVVGNLDQESGIDPEIHQAGGGVGRGIAQWSAGARWDTTPNDNVMAFAAQKGQSATSLTLQFDFIWYELTTFANYGLAELKASTNVTDATQVFEDKFEGCVYANYPECALPSRVNFSKGVLAAYGADACPGGQGGSGGAGGSGGQAGSSAGGNAGSGGAAAGSGGTASGGAAAGSGGAASSGSGGAPVAGTGPTSGGSVAAGGSVSAGGPAVGGSVATGGSAPVAGATSTGGSVSFPNAATSNDDGSCAFTPTSSHGEGKGLALLAVLGAVALRRRRQ